MGTGVAMADTHDSMFVPCLEFSACHSILGMRMPIPLQQFVYCYHRRTLQNTGKPHPCVFHLPCAVVELNATVIFSKDLNFQVHASLAWQKLIIIYAHPDLRVTKPTSGKSA